MENYEIIDRLSGAVEMMAGIIREQAAIIAQADVPEATKELLDEKRAAVADELDVIEYRMRRR